MKGWCGNYLALNDSGWSSKNPAPPNPDFGSLDVCWKKLQAHHAENFPLLGNWKIWGMAEGLNVWGVEGGFPIIYISGRSNCFSKKIIRMTHDMGWLFRQMTWPVFKVELLHKGLTFPNKKTWVPRHWIATADTAMWSKCLWQHGTWGWWWLAFGEALQGTNISHRKGKGTSSLKMTWYCNGYVSSQVIKWMGFQYIHKLVGSFIYWRFGLGSLNIKMDLPGRWFLCRFPTNSCCDMLNAFSESSSTSPIRKEKEARDVLQKVWYNSTIFHCDRNSFHPIPKISQQKHITYPLPPQKRSIQKRENSWNISAPSIPQENPFPKKAIPKENRNHP